MSSQANHHAEEPLLKSQANGYGYYPARVGELLNKGHYEVIGKLGWGEHSSTWAIADIKAPERRYHAVKILTAHATQQNKAGKLSESQILQAISAAGFVDKPTANDAYDKYAYFGDIESDEEEEIYHDAEYYDVRQLPQLLDEFEIKGPHGEHLCFVVDIYGEDVAAFKRVAPGQKLPLHTVKLLVGSVLQPLAKLHSMKIVHAHVTPQKILFHQGLSGDQLEQHFKNADVTSEEDVEIDGVKFPVVKSNPVPTSFAWNDEAARVGSYVVYLTGLSHGQFVNKIDGARVCTRYSYRAPEIVLGAGFDAKADIWSLGSLTFELLTGRPCFTPEECYNRTSQEDYLAKAMQITGGTFPATLLAQSELRDGLFTETGQLKHVDPLPPVNLEEILAQSTNLTPEEVDQAASFMRACLQLDPELRSPAHELDLHDWLMGANMCADYRKPVE